MELSILLMMIEKLLIYIIIIKSKDLYCVCVRECGGACVLGCVRAGVRACMRACVDACVSAGTRACVCV